MGASFNKLPSVPSWNTERRWPFLARVVSLDLWHSMRHRLTQWSHGSEGARGGDTGQDEGIAHSFRVPSDDILSSMSSSPSEILSTFSRSLDFGDSCPATIETGEGSCEGSGNVSSRCLGLSGASFTVPPPVPSWKTERLRPVRVRSRVCCLCLSMSRRASRVSF